MDYVAAAAAPGTNRIINGSKTLDRERDQRRLISYLSLGRLGSLAV